MTSVFISPSKAGLFGVKVGCLKVPPCRGRGMSYEGLHVYRGIIFLFTVRGIKPLTLALNLKA